jgi:hypothetical protein
MNDTGTAVPSPLAARSTAAVPTASASRYLQQLCKHFAHKRPVEFDKLSGVIALSAGDCRLNARDGVLALDLAAADAESLARLQETVERHLVRFAFREEMRIDWRSA